LQGVRELVGQFRAPSHSGREAVENVTPVILRLRPSQETAASVTYSTSCVAG